MTTIQLHPRSLVLGLAIGACALFALAQSAPQYATVRMQYMPHPRDMLRIFQGAPFTVPTGKLFVLTGLGFGTSMSGGPCGLRVNGVNEIVVNGLATNPPESVVSIASVPLGRTMKAGDTIDIGPSGTGGGGRAWGYLADQ